MNNYDDRRKINKHAERDQLIRSFNTSHPNLNKVKNKKRIDSNPNYDSQLRQNKSSKPIKYFLFTLLSFVLLALSITLFLINNSSIKLSTITNKFKNNQAQSVYKPSFKSTSQDNDQNNTSSNSNTAITKNEIDKIIDISSDTVKVTFQDPNRIDKNEYNSDLWVYNKDYNNLMMIGIDGNKCSSFFTNSSDYMFFNSLKMGTPKANCEATLSKQGYTKKNDNIWLGQKTEINTFFDSEKSTLSSIQISILSTKNAITFDEKDDNELINHYLEKQMYDLINSIRVKNGKPAIKLAENVSSLAKNHCIDMIKNNYFSHIDLNGKKPYDRLKDAGVACNKVAENISAGHRNSIFATESLMSNSEHRNNILGDFQNIGVGIYQGGKHRVYYTQVYYN